MLLTEFEKLCKVAKARGLETFLELAECYLIAGIVQRPAFRRREVFSPISTDMRYEPMRFLYECEMVTSA